MSALFRVCRLNLRNGEVEVFNPPQPLQLDLATRQLKPVKSVTAVAQDQAERRKRVADLKAQLLQLAEQKRMENANGRQKQD